MRGTIRDIVSFAAPEARQDDERLRRALCITCADDFVDVLDNGADTLLGKREMGLYIIQNAPVSLLHQETGGVLILDNYSSPRTRDAEHQ